MVKYHQTVMAYEFIVPRRGEVHDDADWHDHSKTIRCSAVMETDSVFQWEAQEAQPTPVPQRLDNRMPTQQETPDPTPSESDSALPENKRLKLDTGTKMRKRNGEGPYWSTLSQMGNVGKNRLYRKVA